MSTVTRRRPKHTAPASEPREERTSGHPPSTRTRCFLLTLTGGMLLWAAFPPLGWGGLAWVAPVFWLLLAADKQPISKSGYLLIWSAATIHWLALLQGIRLPHPALYVGWFALSAYLGVYVALFIGLTRVATHRMRLPMLVAAPVIWTGLELLRGRAFTGFSMGLMAHTQANWTSLIQISDLFGAYAVGFVMIFVAACIARIVGACTLRGKEAPIRHQIWQPLLAAFVMIFAVLGYGTFRMRQDAKTGASADAMRVAIIQGSFDTFLETDQEAMAERFSRYRELTYQAVTNHRDIDLVVWPESMFTGGLAEILVDGEIGVPEDCPIPDDEFRQLVKRYSGEFETKTKDFAFLINQADIGRGGSGGIHMLVGCDTQVYQSGPPDRYNAALMINPEGDITGRYFKMHPVMFGEYIPFGEIFPWLYEITPMPRGMSVGSSPEAFAMGDITLAPNICFESTVPHLIRGQVAELADAARSPDVLVNVTNDGWFMGSAILDLHYLCGIFRAIESRRPVVIAANTGFSAIIDGNGRAIQRGPRRREQVLVAELPGENRRSLYVLWGDWFAGVCLLFCLGVAIVGSRRTRRTPK